MNIEKPSKIFCKNTSNVVHDFLGLLVIPFVKIIQIGWIKGLNTRTPYGVYWETKLKNMNQRRPLYLR